jgi:hypothetical protein
VQVFLLQEPLDGCQKCGIAPTHARWLSKGLYDRAVDALGHVGITDVITLMGFDASAAMTLAFYDVPASATGMER